MPETLLRTRPLSSGLLHLGQMKIVVNEIERECPVASTAGAIRDRVKPEADVLIVNGLMRPETNRLTIRAGYC